MRTNRCERIGFVRLYDDTAAPFNMPNGKGGKQSLPFVLLSASYEIVSL